jgi:quercetin dioxygenase-like cupin family protein
MPRHTNTVEHEQSVLRGRARVGVGERVFEVGPQQVLYIPAGAPHFYEVLEAPFEFLCVVPNAEDRIEIVGDHPRSGSTTGLGGGGRRSRRPPRGPRARPRA